MTQAATQDGELNQALCRDLDRNFEMVVLAYQQRLFAFAMQFAGNREDAEEIAQDSFIRAYHALRTYPAERIKTLAIKPWLYRITLNLARNHHRRSASRPSALRLETDGSSGGAGVEQSIASDEQLGPEPTALRYEQSSDLSALLFGLPERYRLPVILRHVRGMTYPEAAAILDQPQGTVKANVHRGIKLLRERMREQSPHPVSVN